MYITKFAAEVIKNCIEENQEILKVFFNQSSKFDGTSYTNRPFADANMASIPCDSVSLNFEKIGEFSSLNIKNNLNDENQLFTDIQIDDNDAHMHYKRGELILKEEIHGNIPSTVINSLEGKTLNNVIELPGFETIEILSADKGENNSIVLKLSDPELIHISELNMIEISGVDDPIEMTEDYVNAEIAEAIAEAKRLVKEAHKEAMED